MAIGATLFPLDFQIPREVIYTALAVKPGIVGLCFRLGTDPAGNHLLHIDSVIWNGYDPIQDTELVVEPQPIPVPGSSTLYDFSSDERVVLSHYDFDDHVSVPPLIQEFDLVFVDKSTLMHYLGSSFNTNVLYVSRAVVYFFEAEGDWQNYRTLKFSPFPFPMTSVGVVNGDSVAYYIAPSCPPVWRSELDIVGILKFSQGFGRSIERNNEFEYFQFSIKTKELYKAYEKVGINFSTPKSESQKAGLSGFKKLTAKENKRFKDLIKFYSPLIKPRN